MKAKWLYTLVLLVAGAIGLQAQERVVKVDSAAGAPQSLPLMGAPVFLPPWHPFDLSRAADLEETKEQRAARINRETYQRVMASARENLRPLQLSGTERFLLFIGSMFLTSPYKFRAGTVPVMNASNPFIYAIPPGGAPYEPIYSPSAFPQCIRTEFDFRSGTYRQVMVKWNEVEQNMARSFGGPYRTEPVPKVQFHSTDRLAP